jgi:Spy/CpxP family protein refolding chaperone
VKVMTSKLAALATGLALLSCMAMAQNETAPAANGHRGMRGGFMGGAPEIGMLLRKVDLTAEQKTAVKQIWQSEKSTIQPLMKQEMTAHQQITELITGGKFDQAQASAILAKESQLHLQLEMAHAKMASKIFNQVLTSDQQSKVKEMIAERQQRVQQREQERGQSAQSSQ